MYKKKICFMAVVITIFVLLGFYENIYDDKIESLNKEIKCSSFFMNNKEYGTLAKTEEGKEVLKKVADAYLTKNNIDSKDVISIDIKANIDYKDTTNNISKIDSTDKVAGKILKENDKNPLIEVKIECMENRIEDVKPKVKVIESEEMYIGDSREVIGNNGSKEVLAEVTYINGQKKNDTIIKEKILEEASDTLVYKGTKNPIQDGVAFLQHPTRGGNITSNFGFRWGKNHNGIDIAHNIGDPIYSAFNGVVKECTCETGYGNKILIQHDDGIQTLYGHLSEFCVKAGDVVKKGDLIGKVGNTERSTGSHLHFEVRVNGTSVDPTKYIIN